MYQSKNEAGELPPKKPSASPPAEVFDDDEVLQSILAQIEDEERARSSTQAVAEPRTTGASQTSAVPKRTELPPLRAPSFSAGAHTLHADLKGTDAEEESRLQALVELTAGTPLFKKPVPSKKASAAPHVAGDGARHSEPSPSATHTSLPRGAAAALPVTATVESSWSLREEEKVLDSILDAIHCQQSSVSGDIAGDPRTQKVEDVLQRAELVASTSVLAKEITMGTRSAANRGKGDHVLQFHEHVALRTQLEKMASSLGRPTCSCLAPVCAEAVRTDEAQPLAAMSKASQKSSSSAPAPLRPYAAIGTSLSVAVLLTKRWESIGVLGSIDPEVVRARSAVVSVALTEDGQTCATGHAKGTFILWSVPQLAAIRVLPDEFAAPVLSIRALHAGPSLFVALDASGTLCLLRPSRMIGTSMIRTTTIVQPKTTATPLADFDVIPYPSSAYLMDTNSCVSSLNDSRGVAALFVGVHSLKGGTGTTEAVAPSGLRLTVPDRHLIACVFSDMVLVFTLDHSSSTAVARHMHPPTSSLSNELVQFLPLEQERPEIRLCVSWNTELELLRVRFDITGEVPAVAPELERLATIRHPAPIVTLCAVGGGNALYVDQEHRATLMDAAVAVEAERPALSTHLDILSFTDRLCGVKYKGAMSSNRHTVLTVGRKTAFSMTVLPWYARLDALIERQQFPKALDLLQSFTQEVALATVGMSSQAVTRRKALSAYMTKLSVVYVTYASAQPSASAPARALATATSEVLARCSAMDMLPVFFGSVMTALRKMRKHDIALYALEAAMCNHLVTSLPEPLIDAFYGLFSDTDRLAAVDDGSATSATSVPGTAKTGPERAERALLHLEDGLETLLALAAEHGLVRLHMCVLSLRQGQYVKALDVALAHNEVEVVAPTLQAGSTAEAENIAGVTPAATSCGVVAVKYVCATLQGLSMVPEVELPLEHRARAKRLLWESFFEPCGAAASSSTPRLSRLERLLLLGGTRVVQALLVSLAEIGPCAPWSWRDTRSRSQSTDVAPAHGPPAPAITGEGSTARISAIVAVIASLVREPTLSALFLSRVGHTGCTPQRDDAGTAKEVEGEDTVDEDGRHLAAAPFFRVYEVAQRAWPPYSLIDQYLSGIAKLIAAPDCPFLQHEFSLGADESTSGNAPVAPPRRGRADALTSPPSLVWPRLAGCLASHFVYRFRTAEDDQGRRRAQDALIECMRAPPLTCVSFRSFEADFTRNNMARATAALRCEVGDYSGAIDSFLNEENGRLEPDLAKGVFSMLSAEMGRLASIAASTRTAHLRVGDAERASDDTDDASAHAMYKRAKAQGSRLRRAVMDCVPALVKVDATALAQFVFEYLPSNNAEVIRVLRNSSDTFLKYLDELIAKRDPAVLSDMGLQNTYIELLSAHDASKVLPYLERQGTAITYDIQKALRVVRRYHVTDAAIYLQERMNLIPEAMRTLLDALEIKLHALRAATIGTVRRLAAATAEETAESSVAPSVLPLGATSAGAAVTRAAGESADGATTAPQVQRPPRRCSAARDSRASLFEGRYTLLPMAPIVREVDKFFELGEGLCSTYDSGSGNAGSYWFQLLDLFATPRRLLSQRLEQHAALTKEAPLPHGPGDTPNTPLDSADAFAFDEMDAAFGGRRSDAGDGDDAGKSPAADSASTMHYPRASLSSLLITAPPLERLLSDAEVCYTQTMVDMLTSYTSSLLHGMIDVLDMTTVVEKVVKDHEQERFAPFRPIILDVMSSIRFNVKAHRLAQTCAVDDVARLGRELYRHLNRGAVPRGDTCCLCHAALADAPSCFASQTAALASTGPDVGRQGRRDAPLPDRLGSGFTQSRSVLVFGCGHAYHEACAVQWQFAVHNRRCPQCTRRRLGELVGVSDAGSPAGRRAGDTEVSTKLTVMPKPVLDDGTWQRRQRFMRARMSTHSTAYYEILKASVGTRAVAATDSAQAGGAIDRGRTRTPPAGPRLVLSPPPPPAVPTAKVGKPAVDLTSAIAAALTDADILELFGN